MALSSQRFPGQRITRSCELRGSTILDFVRLAILTIGSRGDVQPYAALGLGLQRAGYEVVIATHDLFGPWLEGIGLGFAPVEGNPQELLEGEVGREWLESGSNILKFVGKMAELAGPLIDRMCRDAYAACKGSDAILFSPLGMVAMSIGEKLGIPVIPAFVQPLVRSSAYPCMGVDTVRLPGFLNYASHVLFEQMMWQTSRRFANAFRTEVLGLPPFDLAGPYSLLYRMRTPFLLGFSEHVVPRPHDWGPSIHVTGYWFLDAAPGWQPPADLVAFLDAGPAPVYVGFGSMTPRNPGALGEMVMAALKAAGARGVVLSGWAGLERGAGTDDVFIVDNVPHDWLFPQMGAVVHHGGAGTTAAGLRAGVPSLLLPFFADQPSWGRRVADRGAGPTFIPQRELTADRLAAGIRQALGDGAMRERAARLGELIRAEDGVDRAVAAVQATLGAAMPPAVTIP